MTTLAEIEVAAAALSPAEKQELLLFLAAKLRTQECPLPAPRDFSSEQIAGWIHEDESDMRRISTGPSR